MLAYYPRERTTDLSINNKKPTDFRSFLNLVSVFNSSSSGQNGRLFADDVFKHIFLNENLRSSNKMSMKYIPWGPINNMPALAPGRRQAIIWTNADLVHRRIYVALGEMG